MSLSSFFPTFCLYCFVFFIFGFHLHGEKVFNLLRHHNYFSIDFWKQIQASYEELLTPSIKDSLRTFIISDEEILLSSFYRIQNENTLIFHRIGLFLSIYLSNLDVKLAD